MVTEEVGSHGLENRLYNPSSVRGHVFRHRVNPTGQGTLGGNFVAKLARGDTDGLATPIQGEKQQPAGRPHPLPLEDRHVCDVEGLGRVQDSRRQVEACRPQDETFALLRTLGTTMVF